MSYNYRILNDRPRHFYPLTTGATPYADATTRSNGEVIGVPTSAPPLVVGGGNAMSFTGNDNFRFLTSIFHQESVLIPFSLEAWFKPINVTQAKGILGHLGIVDGLTFDGEKISFTTLHGSAGAATASYFPPNISTSFYVLGVHTGERNELYVNGVRVSSVDLTTQQISTPYDAPTAPGYLYSGHLPGSVVVDSVAVYPRALTSRQAKLHFLWGRDAPDFRDVVARNSGTLWDFADASADIAYELNFETTEDWATGQSASVSIENNTLSPSIVNALTVEGTWLNGFILGAVTGTADSSKIWWDGDGSFTVQTSLDGGSSWSTATNGREIPGIGPAFSSGNQSLSIRVVFAAGEPDTTITKIRKLNLKLYRSRSAVSMSSTKKVVLTNKTSLASEVYQPIEQNDLMGLNLHGGYSTLQSGDAVRTIEMWFSPETLPAPGTGYVFDARPAIEAWLYWNGTAWAGSPGTIYILNGVETLPANIKMPAGSWNHLVVVLPLNTTAAIYLGARNSLDEALKSRIGFLSTYSTVISSSQAASFYNAYLGIPSSTVSDTSILNIQDPVVGSPTKIYAYSWSTTGSG